MESLFKQSLEFNKFIRAKHNRLKAIRDKKIVPVKKPESYPTESGLYALLADGKWSEKYSNLIDQLRDLPPPKKSTPIDMKKMMRIFYKLKRKQDRNPIVAYVRIF